MIDIQLDEDNVLRQIDIGDAIDYYGIADVLEVIGRNEVIEYFNIVEAPEEPEEERE